MKASGGQYKKLIKKLWRNPEIVNLLFNNKEWQQHNLSDLPSKEDSDKMHAHILQRVLKDNDTEKHVRNIRARLFTIGKYAVAATILVLVSIAIWIKPSSDLSFLKDAGTAIVQNKPNGALPPVWREVRNTGNKVKIIPLPDSSTVRLSPKGVLKYEDGFSKPLRNVYLIGKAYFKVKKNPKRPFSVYAGGLKTTALGTSFTINTTAGKQKTSVKLHTGKIVVSPEKSSKQAPVYLTKAGSGLLFDRLQQVATVIPQPLTAKKPDDRAVIRNGTIITMKNIPLIEVIDILSASYKVKILSEGGEIKNISFTGVVDLQKENIESVLQTICIINDLSFTKGAEQEYKLSKVHK